MDSNDTKIIEFATADALVNVFQPDARVESVYGLRPELDGAKNAEHAKHIGVLNERHILKEVRERTKMLVDRAHDFIGERISTIRIKAIGGAVAEVLMASLALYSAGVPFPENFLFGCAVAAVMFALVAFARHKNKAVRYVAMVVMIVLAGTLTVARMDEVGTNEDASMLSRLALPVILLLGTFGIAVMVEPSLAKLRTYWPDLRKASSAERELADREARDAEAQAFVDNHSRQEVAWDNGCARGRSLYASTWKSKRAEIEGTDPTRRN